MCVWVRVGRRKRRKNGTHGLRQGRSAWVKGTQRARSNARSGETWRRDCGESRDTRTSGGQRTRCGAGNTGTHTVHAPRHPALPCPSQRTRERQPSPPPSPSALPGSSTHQSNTPRLLLLSGNTSLGEAPRRATPPRHDAWWLRFPVPHADRRDENTQKTTALYVWWWRLRASARMRGCDAGKPKTSRVIRHWWAGAPATGSSSPLPRPAPTPP